MTRRAAPYCAACRSNVRSIIEHRSTDRHRESTRERFPAIRDARPSWQHHGRQDDGIAPADDYAAGVRLGIIDPRVIAPDDPTEPDAPDPADWPEWPELQAVAPGPCPYTVGRRVCTAGPTGHPGPHDWPKVARARKPRARVPQAVAAQNAPPPAAPASTGDPSIEPCPRCGRADFRTAAGRAWHVENYPSCADHRRPEHQYQYA